jgi:hypothetical protein
MEKSTIGRIVGWKFPAVIAASLILLVIGGLVVRNWLDSDGNSENGVILKANPNPVPSGPERPKVTITWAAPGNAVVQIFVGPPGSTKDKLFIEAGWNGTAEVGFVLPDRQYEFRMYAGKEKEKLLAVLKIPKN